MLVLYINHYTSILFDTYVIAYIRYSEQYLQYQAATMFHETNV